MDGLPSSSRYFNSILPLGLCPTLNWVASMLHIKLICTNGTINIFMTTKDTALKMLLVASTRADVVSSLMAVRMPRISSCPHNVWRHGSTYSQHGFHLLCAVALASSCISFTKLGVFGFIYSFVFKFSALTLSKVDGRSPLLCSVIPFLKALA